MDLDEIKARLDQIFSTANRPDTRAAATGLREALVEFKVGIGQLREALVPTEQQLAARRRDAVDYQRRRDLAAGIGDQETVDIAEDFLRQVREKIDLLERKLLVQRDELHLAEREYQVTHARYQAARQGLQFPDESREQSHDPVIDQQARDAAVEAQLAHLKQKLNRRD